jgi:transposase
VRAVTAHTARLERLEPALPEQTKTWRRLPVVETLQALRGVQLTVTVTIVAALGNLTRFDHPRRRMSYGGSIPSAYSSGERRHQRNITKAGHRQARRVRIEAAWAYRDPAQVSRQLQLRLEQLSKSIQDVSWKAQVRRCQRDRTLKLSRRVYAVGSSALLAALARDTEACSGFRTRMCRK